MAITIAGACTNGCLHHPPANKTSQQVQGRLADDGHRSSSFLSHDNDGTAVTDSLMPMWWGDIPALPLDTMLGSVEHVEHLNRAETFQQRHGCGCERRHAYRTVSNTRYIDRFKLINSTTKMRHTLTDTVSGSSRPGGFNKLRNTFTMCDILCHLR